MAELKIVMTDSPWPFFEHTDLLDFPGARSRAKLTDLPEDAAERSQRVRDMLLRGKIAYLFQRYTEERELTCDAAVHAAQRRRGEGPGEHGEELDRPRRTARCRDSARKCATRCS